jgi:tRNA-specific 2-thiouridylase
MIAVAMSGGVDSSLAAALLGEAGHEVVGVTLRLQACEEAPAGRSCCGLDGQARARAVAGQLGIRHHTLDCAREFEERVLGPAWEEYARGRTPSPCLHCNERIKFELLLDWAGGAGIERLATGHYARVAPDAHGRPGLWRARERARDQTYFLAGLRPEVLRRVIFPLGELGKGEVRARAAALGLASASTPDSQDACLVQRGQGFAETLRLRFGAPARPGRVVDERGLELGRHPGLHLFTVGQRRGLPARVPPRPLWVKRLEPEAGLVVATDDPGQLLARRLCVSGLAWAGEPPGEAPLACEVQVRHRHPPAPARLQALAGGRAALELGEPVRAATPGQAAVFYQGERVLGRGWIESAE